MKDDDEPQEWCFHHFCYAVKREKNKLVPREKKEITKTVLDFYPKHDKFKNGEDEVSWQYARYVLLKFKSWSGHPNSLIGEQPACTTLTETPVEHHQKWTDAYRAFMKTPKGKMVQTYEQEENSAYRNARWIRQEERRIFDDAPENDEEFVSRAEAFLSAQEKLSEEQRITRAWQYGQRQHDYTDDELKELDGWLLRMQEDKNSRAARQHWRDSSRKKRAASLQHTLNREQTFAVNIALRHAHKESQLLFGIFGRAGTGKSVVVDNIVDGLERRGTTCLVGAYTGSAAKNVGGDTLHRLLGFGLSYNNKKMSSQKLSGLQELWNDVSVLVIDEISLIAGKYFERLNRRLQLIKGNDQVPFGGISVIIVGDVRQLPPVAAPSLFTQPQNVNSKSRAEHAKGHWLWNRFQTVVTLTKSNRHKYSSRTFLNGLDLLGEGKLHTGSTFFNMLQTRFTSKFPQSHPVWREYKDAMRLFYGRNSQHLYNIKRLYEDMSAPIRVIEAEHKHESMKRRSSKLFSDAQATLHVTIGARVRLIRNIAVLYGLYNGAVGTIFDIIDHPNGRINSLPRIVLVQMDEGYDGPSVLHHLGKRLVPFVPMRMTGRRGRSARTQVPLVLDWARTIHKAQGLTLERAVVDLRHSHDKGARIIIKIM